MPLLSSCEFASLAQYAVRGTSKASQDSKEVSSRIKRAVPTILGGVVKVLAELRAAGNEVGCMFGPEVVVVSVPGHGVRSVGALSVPEEICRYLVEGGLAGGVLRCLDRTRAVQKSATARQGARPGADEHYVTIALNGLALANASRLLLVDDVVTSGATLLACVSMLRDAFPRHAIGAFAVMRAISNGEVTATRHPCTGTIVLDDLSRLTTRRP